MKPPQDETYLLKQFALILIAVASYKIYSNLSGIDLALAVIATVALAATVLMYLYEILSKSGRDRRKKIEFIKELPNQLIQGAKDAIVLGKEHDLGITVHLPDSIRSRHVHIIGATGSG